MKKNDEIKDAHPKKICHMPKRHVKKKREKDAYPKKVCHMPTRHVKRKKKEMKDKSTSKENKEERWIMQRSSSTLCQKNPHTCTS